jgi:hypothetical protein
MTSTLVLDCEFSYLDLLHRKAAHRTRLFDNGAWATLIITDMSRRRTCPSVTNSIEELMNAFLREHPEIKYERLVIIEHYGDREWNQSMRRRDQSGRDEDLTWFPSSRKLSRAG